METILWSGLTRAVESKATSHDWECQVNNSAFSVNKLWISVCCRIVERRFPAATSESAKDRDFSPYL